MCVQPLVKFLVRHVVVVVGVVEVVLGVDVLGPGGKSCTRCRGREVPRVSVLGIVFGVCSVRAVPILVPLSKSLLDKVLEVGEAS